MNQQYTLSPDGFSEVRKRILQRAIPTLSIPIIVILSAKFYGGDSDLSNVAQTLLIAIVAVGFGIFISLKKQKQLYESYQLTIGETSIVREQQNTPTISIEKSEMQSITQAHNGDLVITSLTSAKDIISVPSQTANFEALRQELETLCPITIQEKKPLLIRLQWLIVIGVLALMGTVYIAENKIMVGFAGTALTVVMGYGIWSIQRNKNVDKRTKRMMWLSLIPILSILTLTIAKLTQ